MIFFVIILVCQERMINMPIPKCEGARKYSNHGKPGLRVCGNPAYYECPSCDKPLCLKCSYDASRHRKRCYGGKSIDKKEFQEEIRD